MSYVRTPALSPYVPAPRRGRRLHRRLARRGMSGFFDTVASLFGGAAGAAAASDQPDSYTACASQADSDVAFIDTKAYDLAQNWQPTGFYVPSDVDNVVGAVQDMINQGYNALSNAKQQAPVTQRDLLAQMTSNLNDVSQQSLNYIHATAAAKASGSKVNAPGLKQWVLDSMTAASSAVHAASVVSCQLPWWVAALQAVYTAVTALWNIAKAIVGVAIAIGEKVVTAAEGALDLVAWIEKYGPYAAIGLGALYIVTRKKKAS